MHDHLDLILTITGGLTAALLFALITRKLGLSPIVGYLLAGIAVGPHTPGFDADAAMASQCAEIGVILLMFGVGLQFHLEELLAVRAVAIPGAVFQSAAATLLGVLVVLAFGGTWPSGLVYGLALSVASTVVLLRVLADNKELHTPTGHIAVGWLVVEDVFTVLVLVLLPVLFGGAADGGAGAGDLWLAVGLSVAKLVTLVVFVFVVGGRVIPWLLTRVARTGSRELFTLTVLVLALGIAVGSAKVFGASMALGAFLAGLVVGRSEFSLRAATEALPLRDAFAVLFFVSVGMLFDPRHLLVAPGMVAATLAVVLLAKPLAAVALVLVLRYPLRTALAVAVALAQIGEFSFILGDLGRKLGLLDQSDTNTLVAVAIASITLNPLLYRLVGPLERLLGRAPAGPVAAEARGRFQAVVVGYGPVGRTLAGLLRGSGIEPVIIEMNLDTVRALQAEGIRAIYGDAARRETLAGAGVAEAVCVVLSASGVQNSVEVVRLARELNPRVRVYARAAYLREASGLRDAGADSVFSGEGEVALAMTTSLLRDLGAPPEQIDRERDRLRDDLVGARPTVHPLPVPPADMPVPEASPQGPGGTPAG